MPQVVSAYLTPPAVAERFAVDTHKVLGWIRTGRLRAEPRGWHPATAIPDCPRRLGRVRGGTVGRTSPENLAGPATAGPAFFEEFF